MLLAQLKIAPLEIGKLNTLGLLFALLPGFLTYVIVHALIKRGRKPEAVEAILHALAYTVVVHGLWAGVSPWLPTTTPEIVGVCVTAVILAVVMSALIHHECLYRLSLGANIAGEDRWYSMWENEFRRARQNVGEYAVIQLTDGRRLRGCIRGYSEEQAGGLVTLDRCKWLVAEGSDLPRGDLILIPAENIEFVHFLKQERQ